MAPTAPKTNVLKIKTMENGKKMFPKVRKLKKNKFVVGG